MRLFSVAFALSAFLTAASAFGQSNEPLTSGSTPAPKREPGWARFQESPGHQYRVQLAREERAYGQALNRYYTSVGYDYAHPVMNAGSFSIPIAPRSRYNWSRGIIIAPATFY